MKIIALETGNFKSDGGAMFGVVPKILWSKLIEPDRNNLIPMKSRSLLIDLGTNKILIDTGLSTLAGEKYTQINHITYEQGTLLENLEAQGYSPEDITDIIYTHLHHDHCGNFVSAKNNKLQKNFPKARIWLSKQHFLTVKNPNLRERAAFIPQYIEPILNSAMLNLIPNDTELFPNIFIKIHNGHTQGLITVHIKYNNKWIVFASDFIPTAHHIYEPYIMSYDMCAEKTLKEKAEFFKWIADKEVCIFLQHDFYNECVTIKQTEKGHKADKKFSLEQWLN